MATHASFKNYLKSNKHILDGGHYLPPSPLWMELNNRHPQYIHSFWNMWFKFKLVQGLKSNDNGCVLSHSPNLPLSLFKVCRQFQSLKTNYLRQASKLNILSTYPLFQRFQVSPILTKLKSKCNCVSIVLLRFCVLNLFFCSWVGYPLLWSCVYVSHLIILIASSRFYFDGLQMFLLVYVWMVSSALPLVSILVILNVLPFVSLQWS